MVVCKALVETEAGIVNPAWLIGRAAELDSNS
jgi:hypothetical protein